MMDEDDVISNEEGDISAFDDKSADFWTDQFGEDDDDAEVAAFDDIGDDEAFARMIAEMLNLAQQNLGTDDICDIQGTEQVIKRVRKPKKVLMWTEDDGIQRPILPRQSYWYNIYIAHPDIRDTSCQKKFRFRFRLPYEKFKELLQDLESEDMFQRWHDGKINPWSRQKTAPISLLLLALLRYLGRGWTFYDLAENTAISQEVIRVFFHKFIEYGSTVLYRRYVRPPRSNADARVHIPEFELAGFPGAIGSCDATHIMLERVSYRFRQSHLGFKMTHTARTYNITVNHRRQILATTSGHPARWNDKTLAMFDDFMQALHRGTIMNDMHFELYAHNTNGGAIIKERYKGAWLLVDNGYLAWPTTVPPIKITNSRDEIRFSAWLESMRKDVECTFGILKGRWRILKTGIRLFGVKSADQIFLTCCALHNWLLEIDGLDERWGDGVASEWEGSLGDHDVNEISRAVLNLHNPVDVRNYDLIGLGVGSDVHFPHDDDNSIVMMETEVLCNDEVPMSGVVQQLHPRRVQSVRLLTLNDFRSRLIVHFNIAFQKNEVRWPRCRRDVPNHTK